MKDITKSGDEDYWIDAANCDMRFRFHKGNQEEGESVTMFLASLRQLVEHCEFRDALNDTLRDRLVCGLRNEAAPKTLLTESDLTLDKAINISVTKKHRLCMLQAEYTS